MFDTTGEKVVLQVKHSNYSEIVINSPKTLNSFSISQIRGLYSYFKLCEDDNNVQFVIFRGVGRAFCAGGDIKNIIHMYKNNPSDLHLTSFEMHRLLYFMASKNKPSICYMDGITAGGGLAFAQQSTFKIATENTVAFLPEGRIGHYCDASNSFFMSRLDGHIGVYLALTGHQIKAEDVVFAGLATHFVPSSELENLGERLSQLQSITLDTIDSAIQEVAVKASHNPIHRTLCGENRKVIERCFKYNTVEKIIEALKKEDSKFAQSCLKSMLELCPLSLKLTLYVLRRGADSTMFQCIDYDSRRWRVVPDSYNYAEGVYSLLEKRRPQWKPTKIEDVQDITESRHFPKEKAVYLCSPEADFTVNPYQRFLPPIASEVRFIEINENLKSHKDIIDWFLENRKFKFGTKEIVEDILIRCSRKTTFLPDPEYASGSKL